MRFEKDKRSLRIADVALCEKDADSLITRSVSELHLDTKGIVGSKHYGHECISGGRLKKMYAPGTSIRNNRQWSAISEDDLELIARELNLDEIPSYRHLGINILIEDECSLSQEPPLTYLVINSKPEFEVPHKDNVVLVVYGQLLPCTKTGKVIAGYYADPSLESKFPKASRECRGITGWVEKGGIIRPGDTVWTLTPTGYC